MSHPQVAQLSRPEVLNNSDRLLALLLSLREEVNKFVQIAKYICKFYRMYLYKLYSSQLQKRIPQVEKGGLSPSELVSSLVKLIASNNAAVKGEVFPNPKPSFVFPLSVFLQSYSCRYSVVSIPHLYFLIYIPSYLIYIPSSVFCKGVPLAHLSCCQRTRPWTVGGEYAHKGEDVPHVIASISGVYFLHVYCLSQAHKPEI